MNPLERGRTTMTEVTRMSMPPRSRLALLIGAGVVAVSVSLVIRWIGSESMAATQSAHIHEAKLKNADGTWKYTNALAKESSPYLLQHAHNPVDWYAWGEEAFELARKSGKPIFLSVGYSTCYWCHVMERQCFEDPKIAELMNQWFVNIKVDREERPDVDDIYMAATQMMTRRGGWPMSVFLTPPGAGGPDDPGLKPFYAATYIPPEPAHGMPGFPQVLNGMAGAWSDQRDKVLKKADEIAGIVAAHLSEADDPAEVDASLVQEASLQLLRSYDHDHGGFGRAPKFPQPSNLMFVMRAYQNNPNADLWAAISYTLERMARGGMYDQIGGGFHRYSTDGQWLVPHFEKMLYDNGQLIETYLYANAIKPDKDDPELYTRVVREICDYVLREMTDSTGTFWSAQDAEVDAKEGGNYVWLPDQVREAVPDNALAELALRLYGLDRGTNFQDPHHPQEPRTNVLFLPQRLDELAREREIPLGQLLESKQRIDEQMLAVRDQRKQPGTDDKVLISWNGIMIAAMARAGRELDESRYRKAAVRAARYILDHMRTEDGGLYRTMRRGTVKIEGFLEDYAFFVHALLELFRTEANPKWLEAAKQLVQVATEKFGADQKLAGGYYDTLADQADLFVRTRTTYDGAIPTGNSQMVHNLIDLYDLTENVAYLDRAAADLKSFGGTLRQQGVGMVHMQHAVLRAIEAAPLRFTATAPATSQPAKSQVVRATADPKVVDLSSGSITVTVTLEIDKAYHLNAHEVGNDALVPTTLALVGAESIPMKVDYPSGEDRQFPFADAPIRIYENRVVFEATIRKIGPLGSDERPQLLLRYQACTERECLRPVTIEVPIAFEGLD